jgi:hypothetical protein
MKKVIQISLAILMTLALTSNVFGAKEALHTIRDFEVSDGVLKFNIYSLRTDEELAVGPTTFAINYNENALANPYLTNINSKYNTSSFGYGDMSIVIAGGSILITINHTGTVGSLLTDQGTYGEVICTVGLNIIDVLATAEISWNVVNSAMFQPNFGLLDSESFNVIGEPNPPLPVELVGFFANVSENLIELSWQTASELNNFGFSIERKVNDKENRWSSIGFQKSAGDSRALTDYSFIDKSPVGGTIFNYRLKQINLDGTFDYSDEVQVTFTPEKFALHQNFPNPFNPSTKIRFTLQQESDVKIKVFDQLGQEVTRLLDTQMESGYHEVEFNAAGYASGLYFYSIEAGSFTEVKKMMLLK